MKYTAPVTVWVVTGTEHRGQGSMVAANHPRPRRGGKAKTAAAHPPANTSGLRVAFAPDAINTNTTRMSDPHPDTIQLVIRCPSCGQRFKVGENLQGRTVECGACEHRFRITDDVIVRGKKFYPGEKHDSRLMHFQRVPMSVSPPLMGTEVAHYAEPPDPAVYEPAPPQRILAGIAGVAGILLMALLLIFGARSGGALDGMITSKRMLMAGFTALTGISLLVYANPRARLKALTAGFLLGCGLLSLPLVFTAGSVPMASSSEPVERDLFEEALDPGADDADAGREQNELRELIGTDPLEEEIQRLEAAGEDRRAVGLWLRDMREQHRFLIMDYILRSTGADKQSHFYPRGHGDFLLVVTGIKMSIDEIARLAEPLGTVRRIHHDLAVVEVKVDNQNFIEGPIGKLSDRNDPAFYDLNKRELESIDMGRVGRAVNRLAEAEPKVYRSDITSRLLALLAMPDLEFKADVCRALEVWSPESGAAGEAAMREAGRLLARDESVPPEMISLALKEKTPGLAPLLHQLWEQDPNQWEMAYGQLGANAETPLLRRLPTADGIHRASAVRLLGRVGGTASLPVLEAAMADANAELRVLLDKAIAAIRGRLDQ